MTTSNVTRSLVRLWLAGVPARKIANTLGLSSEHYVYTRARALGLPGRKPATPDDPWVIVLGHLRARLALLDTAIDAVERMKPSNPSKSSEI